MVTNDQDINGYIESEMAGEDHVIIPDDKYLPIWPKGTAKCMPGFITFPNLPIGGHWYLITFDDEEELDVGYFDELDKVFYTDSKRTDAIIGSWRTFKEITPIVEKSAETCGNDIIKLRNRVKALLRAKYKNIKV